jgi:hypothetical protein
MTTSLHSVVPFPVLAAGLLVIMMAMESTAAAAKKDQQYYYTQPPAYMKPSYDGPYNTQSWGEQDNNPPKNAWKASRKTNPAAVNTQRHSTLNQTYNDFKPATH